MIAAESTRLFSALFAAINDRVTALASMMKNDNVKKYIADLPEITQDLCKMFYRCSSHTILEVIKIII